MTDPSEVGFLDEDYEEARWREKERKQDLPIEYWTLQKLVKFMKIGNQVVTNACLCCIRDFNLTTQLNQRAIFSVGGLETLVNLCKSGDFVCRIGALYVLRDMSTNIDMRRYMIDMNVIESLRKIVSEPLNDIKCVAVDILGILAAIKPAREIIHKSGVVNKIIDGLQFDRTLLQRNVDAMSKKQEVRIVLAISAATALSKMFTSTKILAEAKKGGLILCINQLLKTVHEPLISAVLGLCHVCSRDTAVQLGLETEKVIVDVTKQLSAKNVELLTNACGILSQCGKNPQTSKLIQRNGGLPAILSTLARFLAHGFNDDILANICGFASHLLFEQQFLQIFLKHTTLQTLLDFFHIEHDTLRIETCHVLTNVCKYPKYAQQMRELDGITYLWTLLRSQNASVQTAASEALCEYLKNDDGSAEYLRKLDNGLEMIASSLKSANEKTLMAICALIVEIAKDSYNLAILTQYEIVPLLADLVHTQNEHLEEAVTAAIASCTPYDENANHFGELKVIRKLISKLVGSKSASVRRAAALALEKLSVYQINAILISESGVVPVLLEDIHSNDAVLRNAAANCLRNLRELTLKAEKHLMMEVGTRK